MRRQIGVWDYSLILLCQIVETIMKSEQAKELRHAFGHFATGVTVTTMGCDKTTGAKRPLAMTANSFSSVSLEPPLILWSIDKNAQSYEAFAHNDHFAVHVLHAGQQALSTRCATRNADKFATAAWQPGIGDAPIFDEYSARFQCQVEHRYEGGDHQIIVGRVLQHDCQNESEQAQPLLFFKGKYCAVA
jgi:flavin reductase (DIM6/NTAB) family NADH-FMN oxidoreductase RutF